MAKRATSSCILEVCTDERRYGPVRVQAPYLTRSDDGKGLGVGNEQHYTATFRCIPPPMRQALSTFPLTSKMCLPPGSRPDRLSAVSGPQERVVRRTVEQIVDCVPVVPLFHTSEPQMVDSVVDMLKILDHSLPGGKCKGNEPCTSCSRTFTIHNYGYVNAYTFTQNNITLEHTAMNDKNTITHTDAYNTQY